MSSAIEELLNIADTANTNTANITVVSLIPLEDDLFIIFPARQVIKIIIFLYPEYNFTKLKH
jgi:chorismate mutase